jgi:hypothetical protein
VRLEGTLDAFNLSDILQLLSSTNKTGVLHLRCGDGHATVHLREGAVSGARSDAGRQALGRRMIGAGLVDDEALAAAIEQVVDEPGMGLGRALAGGGLQQALVVQAATEQVTDAVFELLSWHNGEFTFVMDELDPDDLGMSVPVEEVLAEGRRRLESWAELAAVLPSSASVLSLSPCPDGDPAVTREQWVLLSLVDGVRTVSELVALSGRGEYLVVSLLAVLLERGLLVVGEPGASTAVRRQRLLAALEGRPDPTGPHALAPAFTPALAPARCGPLPLGEAAPSSYQERDANVDRTLLLRLLAGVKGL